MKIELNPKTPAGTVFTTIGVFLFAVGLAICMALWSQANLEFWINYFKGTPVHIPLWMCFIVNIVLRKISLGCNVIAALAKFVV